jgi:hypothetical protein
VPSLLPFVHRFGYASLSFSSCSVAITSLGFDQLLSDRGFLVALHPRQLAVEDEKAPVDRVARGFLVSSERREF